MKVTFPCTNESLDAIIAGLDVKKGDNILAVLGSGDQAFAMIAEGARVVGIDTSELQIKYVNQRIECLRQGNLDEFLKYPQKDDKDEKDISAENCKRYFNSEGRNKRILENLQNLSIINGSILDDELPIGCFNKIYISNVIEWHVRDFLEEFGCKNLFTMHQGYVRKLNCIGSRVNPGCLIYATDSHHIMAKTELEEYGYISWLKEYKALELEKDEELSAKAAKLQSGGVMKWWPAVFRRKA